MSWAWSRPRIFRKSCAWLAEADSRAKLEMAEQLFRSVHHSSIPTLLFAAAEWPIFDLLHRIAINPSGHARVGMGKSVRGTALFKLVGWSSRARRKARRTRDR